MIKLKLLVFSLILLGPCALMTARRDWRMERALPAALCAQSLLLIVSGYFLPFSVGVGILAVSSAAAWLYALVRMRGIRKAVFRLIIPAFVSLLLCLFLYEVCAKRLYLSYDEHSHWGMIVKTICLYDELPRAGRGAPYIQFTYPPSTAMLPAMASTLLGNRDGMAYFGYSALLAGLLLGLCARAGRGGLKGTLLSLAAVYLTMVTIFPLGILRLFVEPAVALLMALIVLGGYDPDGQSLAEDCLYAGMLAMTKNTGPVFLALALLIRLAVQHDRKALRAAGAMLLCGLLGALSYSVYCDVQGIGAVMSPSHFGENMRALLAGTLSEDYAHLPARYLQFLFGHPLSDAGIYTSYGFGTSACVLALTLAMSGAHIAVAGDRRRALRLWAGVWACNLLYMAMIVASYFMSFEPWEVARLSEADRYTMLVALWTGTLAAAMLIFERDTPHKKRRAVLIGLLMLVLLPLSHMEMTVKTFITRDYIHNTVWARDMTDRMTAYVKDELAGQEDVKLLCIGEYQYVEMHYTLAGTIDIGDVHQDWKKSAWAGSAEALEQELASGAYTHVLVCGLEITDVNYDEETRRRMSIDGRYSVLTEQGESLRPYSLYRVGHDADGGVTLAYLSTMPDQEE
ncbi:MAG: hypothetical protein IJD94_03920 [Clostridia bacterium]|nr:hypothetical protein [Clostridia bacterium]